MKTFLKMIVAAIVAVFMGAMAIAYGTSDNFVICTMLVTAIAVSALLGVFDMPAERTKHTSLKDEARSYDQAA